MEYEITNFDGFYVKGKPLRTTNFENKFGEVWNEFLSNYTGGQPVAVYTEYESDFRGEFSFVVGVVSSEKDNGIRVNGGKFAKFHLADREGVFGCWQFIWQSDLPRLYGADFELYNEDGSVDVYVSIK